MGCVRKDLIERGAETVPGEEDKGEGAEDRELGLDRKTGKGNDEGQNGSKGHPPDGNAEFCAMGFGTYRGKLEILVCGELSDDCREESDHPELAEEDEGEDGEDEDGGGEDAFHWA